MERRNLETKEGSFWLEFPCSTDKTRSSCTAPWAWEAIEINLKEWMKLLLCTETENWELRSDNLCFVWGVAVENSMHKMTTYGSSSCLEYSFILLQTRTHCFDQSIFQVLNTILSLMSLYFVTYFFIFFYVLYS